MQCRKRSDIEPVEEKFAVGTDLTEERISLGLFKLLLLLFLLIFIVFPLIYKYSYTLQRNAVFLNFVNWPKNSNLADPAEHRLLGARNFYLTTNDGITLGVWQILPEHLANDTEGIRYENVLDNGQDVVLYNHGNSGTRASDHRVELYKLLRRHFHVIAYDYRSYGDSSNVEPSEDGLVKDVMFMFNWISSRTKSKIFIWGHSLGTGLSVHALALLEKNNKRPYGLILESPFNNMREEVVEHPIASLFKPLPWFYYTVVNPMQENNLTFKSDVHILNVNCPILILHAEDDRVVPFKLGEKLYQTTIETRNLSRQGFVKFQSFQRSLGYGHKYICRSPILYEIIVQFVDEAIKESIEKKLQ